MNNSRRNKKITLKIDNDNDYNEEDISLMMKKHYLS